ncbi:hypothetical protein TEA_026965 [Camellia sinensis var. sinensis]|uniref:Cation/H+ exchanger transmembrane domain-containing protein n=1 Tax=Camellia sinensis var. sinensis TaxID=542762 RepID=A0A4S4F0I0_CAMSN|nr:hypothetical protein TEA_026965 [Camellia sinensis var. sinensis]
MAHIEELPQSAIDGQTPDGGARREGLPSIPPMTDLEPQRHNSRRDTRGRRTHSPHHSYSQSPDRQRRRIDPQVLKDRVKEQDELIRKMAADMEALKRQMKRKEVATGEGRKNKTPPRHSKNRSRNTTPSQGESRSLRTGDTQSRSSRTRHSRIACYTNGAERINQLFLQPNIIAASIDEVSSNTKPLIRQIRKLPKSSPVLGYLTAGILIGPYGLSIIRHVHGTKAIAEFGVVFLMFNIGLELSVERLSSMKKYVFGLGSAQVLVTAVVVGLVSRFIAGQPGPAAIVIGNGLALSSTAVVLQVLQERGESTSRHGRATFSVLLFQDLAVVVLLILIPLISPNSSKGGVGFQAIAEALGLAAVKAIVAITAIIAGGRLVSFMCC